MSRELVTVGVYIVGFLATLALQLYLTGQHYGEAHGGSEKKEGCTSGECQEGHVGLMFIVGVVWPLALVLCLVCLFYDLFIKAGSNSVLPPLEQHPTAKPVEKTGPKPPREWIA